MEKLKRAGLALLAVAVVSVLIGGVFTSPSSANRDQTIVENMTATPTVDQTISLSTAVKAVSASGLAGTLNGTGPYTFFVPNDAAFSKLPAGQWDAVMNDQAKLKKFLMSLVVKGALTKADLANGKKFTTLGGTTLEARTLGVEQPSISDGKKNSPIVSGPTEAKNGVIYILGGVPGL